MPYSIKEAARKLGLTPSTLRYYDKIGLLPSLRRTPSGVRTFREEDIQWLGMICCLKNSGMPLEEIRHFMELCLQGEKSCEERRQMLQRHRETILAQIEGLQRNLAVIDHKIEHYRQIGILHIDA